MPADAEREAAAGEGATPPAALAAAQVPGGLHVPVTQTEADVTLPPHTYVVTLTCGCTWDTDTPPKVGTMLPCPQRDAYRVVWVRRKGTED
jgi:hypothetical protein